jgi:hypothetical protein
MLDSYFKARLVMTITTCLLATIGLLAADESFEAPATGRFIFGPSLGQELLKQCSRATPQGVSGFWKPSTHDIDELELALPKYLAAREKAGQQIPPKGESYHRQYIGFSIGSDRLIYGNFYPGSAATGFWKDKESKQALGVCVGGPVFWGIVFRLSTKTFEDIRFNGLG